MCQKSGSGAKQLNSVTFSHSGQRTQTHNGKKAHPHTSTHRFVSGWHLHNTVLIRVRGADVDWPDVSHSNRPQDKCQRLNRPAEEDHPCSSFLTFISSYFQQRAALLQAQEVFYGQEVVVQARDLSVSRGAGGTWRQRRQRWVGWRVVVRGQTEPEPSLELMMS